MSTTPEKKSKGGDEPPVEFKDYSGPDDRQIALDEKASQPPRSLRKVVESTPIDGLTFDESARRIVAKAERQKKR